MKKTPPLSLYKKIATLFIGLTIVVVGAIFYFSLTYAFIEITPKVEAKEYPISIVVSENKDSIDQLKGIFSGSLVDQTFDLKKTFSSTGQQTVKTNATGRVVIINNNTKPQQLVATTRLLTANNILFRIKDGVNIPAGGRAEVEAYQDDPKIAAGVSVGDKLTVPGLSAALQEVIHAEVISDFSGEPRETTVVSKEDLDKAVEALLMDMEDVISKSAGEGKRVVLKTDILKKEFSKLAGDEASSFEASLSARLSGVIFDEQSVNQYLSTLVEGSIDLDQTLAPGEKISVQYTIDSLDAKNKAAQLNGLVKAPVVVRQNSSILDPKKLVRLSESEVRAYLENYKEIESVSIRFFPFWVRKVPIFTDHVVITIKTDNSLTGEKD